MTSHFVGKSAILVVMSLKLLLRIGINTAIGAVLIWLWLKLVNIEETIQVLERVNPLIIVPGIGLFILLTVFRSLRLKIFLSQYKPSFKDLLNLNFLSQLLSFMIPIRAGELTKAVYLSTQYQIPVAKGVVLIFLDRFFDFWLVVFMSLVLLIMIPNHLPAGLINGLLIMLIIFSVGTFLLVLIPQRLKQFLLLPVKSLDRGFSEKSGKSKVSLLSLKILLVFSFVKKIYTQIVEFVTDIGILLQQNTSRLVYILLLTFGGILSEALVWYILLYSLLGPVNFFSTWLGSMLNALTFLIPAAPGYVGSAEAAGLAVFNLGLGFEKTAVVAATLLYHAFVLIFMLIFGILGLYLLKFDLKLVWSKLRKQGKP